MTLNLSVDIFTLRTAGQELNEVNVVGQRTGRIRPMPFFLHKFNELVEGGSVVVKQQYLISNVHQLCEKTQEGSIDTRILNLTFVS